MASHIFFSVNFFLSIIWESTVVGSWCSGSKWLKPAKTKLTWGDLTIFSQQVSSDPFLIMCFIFKICQTVAGISMIYQFHDFLIFFFGGIWQFGLTVCVWWGKEEYVVIYCFGRLSFLFVLFWRFFFLHVSEE